MLDEEFTSEVLPSPPGCGSRHLGAFQASLNDITKGKVQAEVIEKRNLHAHFQVDWTLGFYSANLYQVCFLASVISSVDQT